ncbi:FAD-dependent oxidoreductase [Pseudarthrobacter enclensis]|uniref:NADPH-dependent 2,4-dienoyl-CoA reductase/sulfur reductase-like enzyme n=1 Tax=Pseudarthrobacter enclensis TaxID=993070 RepID=A0ABT9RYK3_9MICC|nr:FAD-dependent oxidoreductase [Pseudarthrobacter enclensis]MDP9890142.1 NADPH-dependent 2,4-dienoyl-CoA reductase/sulfur reductase-like enzyme [Pseudarthrobacter enclensis]
MRERLVVIGGDAAGMSAASAARRGRGPEELEIVAFERGNHTSYSACGIPYFIGKDVADAESLIARTPAEFSRNHHIDARIRHEVRSIDLDRRAVLARNLDTGGEAWEGFDQLMIGTGASPVRPSLPGIDAEGIYGVQTLDDGLALRTALERQPRRAVIVGAGYIGLELAEAMSAWGLEVTIVGRGAGPMLPALDPDMSDLVTDAVRGFGMTILLGESVTGFETRAGRVSAVLTGQGSIPADVVVLGLGVQPNTALALDAGIRLGPSGAIAVDGRMRASAEGVWAAGDCVEKFHRISRRPVRLPLGTYANKEGRTAGINIGGGYATFPGVVGTAAMKICSTEVARTGLGEPEARDAGLEPVCAVVESTTRAGYYPGARPIRTKLIAERGSGRLLGAQIVGEEGAAKRIDVLSVALWHGTTVEELINMDLAYAPPFSPLWDPVLIAARKAWDKVAATR